MDGHITGQTVQFIGIWITSDDGLQVSYGITAKDAKSAMAKLHNLVNDGMNCLEEGDDLYVIPVPERDPKSAIVEISGELRKNGLDCPDRSGLRTSSSR